MPAEQSSEKRAVLLLAHGTPDTVEEIPCFLWAVTGGRGVPDSVVAEIQHRYSLIGRSPLRDLTEKQAQLTESELGIPVYIGMRNWTPYIPEALEKMTADGVTQAVAICLAPQNSRTSTGLYKKVLYGESGQAPFACDFVSSWHDHPLLIEAFAEKLWSGWTQASSKAGEELPVIFTAHSVPERTISEGDPYESQARETAKLVAEQVRVVNWKFAFQSQGMSGGPWLGPTVEETILGLKEQGHRGVFMQPIGFLCDHVEVLYDIDIAFKQFAAEHGMKLWRAESLNDSPTLASALADIARQRFAATTEKAGV
jgi:protoporphyrin/coproporphyrin ferrochelatase